VEVKVHTLLKQLHALRALVTSERAPSRHRAKGSERPTIRRNEVAMENFPYQNWIQVYFIQQHLKIQPHITLNPRMIKESEQLIGTDMEKRTWPNKGHYLTCNWRDFVLLRNASAESCTIRIIRQSVRTSAKLPNTRACNKWTVKDRLSLQGSGGIAPPFLYLGTRWRRVVSFKPWPLYTWGKNFPAPIKNDAG
jgi:hypothetical protein